MDFDLEAKMAAEAWVVVTPVMAGGVLVMGVTAGGVVVTAVMGVTAAAWAEVARD